MKTTHSVTFDISSVSTLKDLKDLIADLPDQSKLSVTTSRADRPWESDHQILRVSWDVSI